jgi:hypothetical protein
MLQRHHPALRDQHTGLRETGLQGNTAAGLSCEWSKRGRQDRQTAIIPVILAFPLSYLFYFLGGGFS